MTAPPVPAIAPTPARATVRALIGCLLFGALSALIGAFLAIPMNGAGFPLRYLERTPFSSPLIPGLILGAVVGVTQLVGAAALIRRRSTSLLLAYVAGFGMLIWIFTEVAMIREYSWLQTVYFTLGTLEIVLVLALLGIWPATAQPGPRAGPRPPEISL